MVTQRITHKIVYRFVQFDSCLGAAGVMCGIFYQVGLWNEIPVQNSPRAFYHRDASPDAKYHSVWLSRFPFQNDSDDKLIHHFGGNRTVSHHYLL